jgi:RHS repeat-associated protein
VAWDAQVDARSGNHVNVSPVTTAVIGQGKEAVLTLTPDRGWLSDPARVFPITIDPTYASGSVTTSLDTYVSKAYPSATYSTSTELRVGTYNGGADVARSFLNFPLASVAGKDIVSANLWLYEFHSWSCTAKPFYVYSSGAAGSSTSWSNQPAGYTHYGTLSVAKGYSSSCPGGRVGVPVTSMLRAWAGSGWSNGSLRLHASETDNYGWKKFYSVETTADPYIAFTYNRKPNAAAAPTMANGAGYGGSTYVAYDTTTLSSVATDPDGSTVAITFQVRSDTTGSDTSLVASCVSAFVASGATASCKPAAGQLLDNRQLYVRAAVKDDRGLWNGTWSPWTTFRTAFTKPATPSVDGTSPQLSCSGHPNGSWDDTVPAAAVPCTVTIPASPAGVYNQPVTIRAYVDGAVTPTVISTNQQPGTFGGISVPNTQGAHSVKVSLHTASTWSTNPHAVTSFGWGPASLQAPSASPRVSTTGKVSVAASGPPKGVSTVPTAKLRWRVASSGQDESTAFWNDAAGASLTVTDKGPAGVEVAGSWNTAAEVTDATLDADPATDGVQPTTLNPRVPVLLDVQVCLSYTTGTQCTWSDAGSKASVMRLPHAFGNGFPTSEAGPGQVALFTGEFNTGVTDVSVPGYTGDIFLSRSHSTYGNAPTVPTDPVTGVFGPGWTASLEGGEAGLAGLRPVDSTRGDGTLAFIDTDGTALVYLAPGTAPRRTGANLTTGAYLPADEDTTLSGVTLQVTGSGATTTLTLKEEDGTATVFVPATSTNAPASGKDALFAPSTVTEPGSLSTSYTRDTTGRVIRILAPVPPGTTPVAGQSVPCPDGPVTAMAPGCRALRVHYGDGTTATGNTPAGQVWKVTAELSNPAALSTKDCAGSSVSIAAGMAAVPVACYAYDTSKRLVSVTDPRTGLGTSYGYGSSNQLTSITAPGQSPTTLAYATLEGRLKLTGLTRPQAAPLSGTANLTQVLYHVPTSGTGLPDLSKTATDKWDQPKEATYAAAVFGPDYPGSITQADGDGTPPTASDWTYADLSYTTADGYTVNTASYGAGAWQRTSTDYDERGNVVRQLDAGAIDTVTTRGLAPGMAEQYATTTVYNAEISDTTGTTVLPAGFRVTDTYGPAREVVLTTGATVRARPHTQTLYDQGAPNVVNGVAVNPATGQAWSLPTTVTVDAVDAVNAPIAGSTVGTTRSDYTAQVTGTGDGWTLGAATKTTTVMPGTDTDITGVNVYDSIGRITSTGQPLSTGTDAGTTTTVYYTADTSATDPRCDSKPQWAGLTCLVGPAAAATTTATPATLPDEHTSGYSIWLAATTTVEASGTTTRTTTTTMDAAGRPTRSETTATIAGSTPRPAVYTHYDPTTGQADYTGPVDKGTGAIPEAEKTTVYDAWGRPTTTRSETPTGGYDTTTTAYDTAGRVASVTDPKGTTTTTWDGTDANGEAERRGLATKVTVTRAGPAGGVGTLDFAGAYDANGALVLQKLPGGISQHATLDEAGEPTELRYDGQVTPMTARTDANGDPVYDANGDPVYDAGTPTTGTWLAWTQKNDVTGRVRLEYTGAGSSFDPTTSGATSLDQVVAPTGTAFAYDRAYSYDDAGRLVKVKDRTATTTGSTLDPDTAPTTDAPCTVRAYTFDKNGRRTNLSEVRHDDGDCAGTTATTTTDLGYGYDAADRPTTAATGTRDQAPAPAGTYSYDAFGRQTLLPTADAPDPAQGAITLGYYDDDLAHTITQGTATTTLTLDSGGRRTVATTTDSGAGTTTTLERHYADGSDNPAWTVSTDALGQTSATRYTESLGADLAATIGADGSADLTLATIHGHVVTTVDIPATQATDTPATAITGWSDYTEYGTPRNRAATAAVAGTVGYGWLGAKQRSTTTETAGLTLMGVRLYNAVTGRFTSTDPVPGGNDTTYTYPTDPINKFDLDGRMGRWRSWGGTVWRASDRVSRWMTGNSRLARRIRGACSLAWGAVGTACGVAYGLAYARQGNLGRATQSLVSGAVGFGAARYAHRAFRGVKFSTRWHTRRQVRRYRRAYWHSAEIHATGAGALAGGVYERATRRRWGTRW